MNYVKLQFACLVVSVYIVFLYLKQTLNRNYKCNPYFDAIMIIFPWAIIFDGLTAWTVNNLEIVPVKINLVLHFCFFLLMNMSIFVSFIYMLDITAGVPKKLINKVLISVPFVTSVIISAIFMKDLEFIQSKITNYSMGISAISCFASTFIYFGALYILTLVKHKNIEREKKIGIFTLLTIILGILISQIIKPELLLTALPPTMLIAGFYITIEDPSLKKVQVYNNEMVMGFATLVENRDNSTGGHIKRTKGYVQILLNQMQSDPKYHNLLTKDFLNNMLSAAPMHDIGKISTPDQILQKPGKLTDEEFEIMKKHAAAGGQIIKETFSGLNKPDFQLLSYQVARFHHEKWNGKGYPDGLSGADIPICARIMAIADVFDAVSAKRCYRDALPLETCFKIIEEGSGKDFDPELTRLFLEARPQIEELYFTEKDR